jgi:DNA polymerase
MAAIRHILHRDFETRSTARLDLCGAWRYAGDPSTSVLCVGFAIDDGPVQIWTPDQPVPAEFHEAATDPIWLVVAHNNQFEAAIEERLLHPRYGWPLVPLERHGCTQAMALAAALPGSLENAAAALGLPYQKDREGRRLMLRLSRGSDSEPDAEDLQRLYAYCIRDVEVERALFHRLPPLCASEQALWTLDAHINARGFHVDRALAEAAQRIARSEQILIDGEIAKLTNGTITTAGQVAKIQAFIRERGHPLKSLTKHSVDTLLANNPNDEVRRLLELRRDGSCASVRKISSLLAGADTDNRLRGTLRFHGAATGRWSGSRFQPQNLKKPETKDIDAAVDAILAGDMPRLRKLGAPLKIVGDVSRAMICAAPDHILIGGDFSAIESRVLAWVAGEEWKLNTYRQFDISGDPALEPYCVTATRVLKRPVTPADVAGRQIGKIADLACGFGGGLGAWRMFDSSNNHSDAEVECFKAEWRAAHKATVNFWRALETAMRRAIRTGQPIQLRSLTCTFEDGTLYVTLPSGRRLSYPEARLVPGEFDGTTQILFKDNARGGWSDNRGWHGSFTENVVQAIARDLFAATMIRLESANFPVILHVHDEIACEVPDAAAGDRDRFLKLLTELPDWAAGLPLTAKVWRGKRYAKTEAPAQPKTQPPPRRTNGVKSHAAATPASIIVAADPEEQTPEAYVPLPELIGQQLTADGNIHCPFHADSTPSLHIYPDHFHCFGCGAHGDSVDWLMMIEEMSRDEALAVLECSKGRLVPPPRRIDDGEAGRARALRLWQQAKPIAGTLAAQYLAERRRIDFAALPDNVDEVLRFHPNCPFGPGARHPCLLALMRDVASDEPTGIHRIALTAKGGKIDRRTLGRGGAVKLWSAGAQLIVGEGIETVLAAATRISHRGAPLRPAWSAVSSGALSKLPVVAGVDRLLILVDHDLNGQGQAAAARCAERWSRAGRSVTQLKPKQPGTDFNDVIMGPAP